ncbi:hypothetical protein [Comamonas endophytica]|uniref:DUF3887 domain-containing protein n=1 Tax=Comamonas endophytica TaxID=2949090 RepID=A0ABY6G944_9BURK|nr:MULTISPECIES: hypothetical protein [unclassified Acidovorax]MCD2511830.1 hypothetical protein [Acidovorax sp. D4N7]UYG51553.1 hypothetical protein M9799_16105 [Acidovorax sp. 5MLIR]
MNIISRFLTGPLLAAAFMTIVPTAPAAAQGAAAASLHQVDGFRSARFGMSLSQVKQAIAQDFKAGADALSEVDNPAEGTRIVLLRLAALEPGPGPAIVSYIFNQSTQQLRHINVVWQSGPAPSEAQRNQYAVAGVQLTRYFRELGWKPEGSVAAVANGPGSILLFAGIDPKDAMVEVVASGIPLSPGPNGQPAAVPSGPAQLRVSYAATVPPKAALPAGTVKPGAF